MMDNIDILECFVFCKTKSLKKFKYVANCVVENVSLWHLLRELIKPYLICFFSSNVMVVFVY